MSVSIEPARQEDIKQFARDEGFPTLRAWVGRESGEAIALFGFARQPDGRWYAFFDITDKARRHKKQIVRTARMVMEEARKMGLRYVYAQPDPGESLAVRWMQSLGFDHDPRSGTLMRWTNG